MELVVGKSRDGEYGRRILLSSPIQISDVMELVFF